MGSRAIAKSGFVDWADPFGQEIVLGGDVGGFRRLSPAPSREPHSIDLHNFLTGTGDF
jgi:hypothetical protein